MREVYVTRQLPMGAGHCPWGGYTDRIVCNIGPLAAAGEVVTDGHTDRITDHYYGFTPIECSTLGYIII